MDDTQREKCPKPNLQPLPAGTRTMQAEDISERPPQEGELPPRPTQADGSREYLGTLVQRYRQQR